LCDAYPKLAEALDWRPLCTLPTAVEPIAELGERAFVKRDDQTHPIYGGNKLRKLELIAGEIRRRRATEVITFGGTGTNAGVATAMVCQQLGVRCQVLTFDQPPSPTVDKNQALMRHFGARLVPLGPLWAAALAWQLHPQHLSRHTYFLFAGCSNPVATFGYVNAAFELRRQIERGECPEPTEIIVAASTAATLAGLTLGCALAGLSSRVVGVRVAPDRVGPVASCTTQVVTRMMHECRERLANLHPEVASVDLPEPTLLDEFYGAGYGIQSTAGDNAITRAAASGLDLEQTYSGKAFAAFLSRLQRAPGPLMFWNTYNSRPTPDAPTLR
jgi:D-cysteine desulfhydrase